MKALSISSPGAVTIVNEPIPPVGPEEVLCRVARCGICGTDWSILTGRFTGVDGRAVRFPLRPGHEWSGIVERMGSEALGFREGDRVTGDTAVSCGHCPACLRGESYNCPSLRPVGTVNAWPGAMSEYVVFPARHLTKIPDDVSMDQAALAEPAATALYGVHYAPVRPGDRVAVMGTGPIGLAAVGLCRAYGAAQIFCIGRSDFKLAAARELGATDIIHTGRNNAIDAVLAATGGEGVDVALEVSGSPELLAACLSITKQGGTVALIAFYEGTVPLDVDRMICRNVRFLPVPGGFGLTERLFTLMRNGQVVLTSLITHHCTLEDAPEALRNLKENNSDKIKVMINLMEGE